MKTNSGIYCITNKKSGLRYIGSSGFIDKRIGWHLSLLKRNAHPNTRLQSDWNLEGEEGFTVTAIEEVNEGYNLIDRKSVGRERV